MRPNEVKRRMASGGVSIGTFLLEFCTPGIGRIAAAAGAEFAVLDMEHTGWSVETIRMLIASARPTDMVPLVRVPAADYHFIARVLDVGAMGVMVPMVESAAQAARIVQAARYPPLGRRGAAFGVAHDDYEGGDVVAAIESANRETLLIAQIETAGGLGGVEEIAAVEGIDVLWIGHFDLTIALGIPAQFDHPRFHEAVDRVLDACRHHGKVPAMLAGDIPGGRALLDRGFRMIAHGGDLWLYQAALRQGIAELRGHADRATPSRPGDG